MKWVSMASMRVLCLLVLLKLFTGCDSQTGKPAADNSVKAQQTAAVTQPSLEELPDRNMEGMDVCDLLPGSVVASALNMPLAGTESGTEMCSYTLRPDSGPETGVVVSLAKSVSFIFTRNISENAKEVPGLGVAAFTRKATGIHQDLWVARNDGLFLRIAGYGPDIAEPVAKVALETIP